jgi:hypothetical protein
MKYSKSISSRKLTTKALIVKSLRMSNDLTRGKLEKKRRKKLKQGAQINQLT